VDCQLRLLGRPCARFVDAWNCKNSLVAKRIGNGGGGRCAGAFDLGVDPLAGSCAVVDGASQCRGGAVTEYAAAVGACSAGVGISDVASGGQGDFRNASGNAICQVGASDRRASVV